MEYDNDRILKGVYKTEIVCWIFFVALYPLITSLSVFPHQQFVWLCLLACSIFLFPLYLLYGRIAIQRYLFEKKLTASVLWTIVFFGLVFLTDLLLFRVVATWVKDSEQNYFRFNVSTAVRESVWIIVNMVLVTGVLFLKNRMDDKDIRDDLQKENSYYKLRYYRTQLNPHFLFNTLNSIYSLSLNKAEKTSEVIIRLADIMRFLIYDCNEDKIFLDKEVEFIRNYIEIERIRYDADIRFTIEGDTRGVMIEPFLFISFIENGFKHAIDTSFAKPFIYIHLTAASDRIALHVINNTSQDVETQAKKISGKGLVNSKNVLELLYPDAYALDIIQIEKKERKLSKSRYRNAQERLQRLYPDNHTLDVILNNNTFTVSLILTTTHLDQMHHSRR